MCHVYRSFDPFAHHPQPQRTLSLGESDPQAIVLLMSTSLYPLASLAQIEKTPSREDGIPEELELDLRAFGCKLIYEAGVLLRQYVHVCLHGDPGHLRTEGRKQVAVATAQILFQRFWYVTSMKQFGIGVSAFSSTSQYPLMVLYASRTLGWARCTSRPSWRSVRSECAT